MKYLQFFKMSHQMLNLINPSTWNHLQLLFPDTSRRRPLRCLWGGGGSTDVRYLFPRLSLEVFRTTPEICPHRNVDLSEMQEAGMYSSAITNDVIDDDELSEVIRLRHQ